MVCSQVYSQHPSRCLLSVAHQGRSWGSSNAERCFLEVETGEGDCKGNSACGGYSRPSNGYACPGYASTSSPFMSSWIQRLIPANITRAEQAQFTKSLPIEREGFHGLQADWSHDRYESGLALYENSSRSRHNFYNNQESLLGNTTTCNEHIGVDVPSTGRIRKPLEALQPKVQIPPRTLPVVECLLKPGCTKNCSNPHVSTETKKSHDFFRFSVFSNPVKQTVHFSADERSRVSCSSIDGLNFRSGRRVAGDLNASLGGEKCFNALQPTWEFSFNGPEAASRSNRHLIYDGRKVQNYTYSGMDFLNGPQIEGQVVSNCLESRDPVSFTGWPCMERWYRTDKSRSLDRPSMPYKARCIDSLPQCFMQENLSTARTEEGLKSEQKSMQTRSNRNDRRIQDGKGAMFDTQVSCGKRSAFSGGGCSNPGLGKVRFQHTSDLVSSHVGGKASISLAPCLIEQELGSSQESHKEQDVTSGSFSFYSKSRLPFGSADAKVVTERGHWPFCETKPYLEDLVQERVPKNWRTTDRVEAPRPEMSLNHVFTTQFEGDSAHFSRSQCSPFFGIEPLADYGRNRLASEDDCRQYKPTRMDYGGMYSEESKTEALNNYGVIQGAGVKQEKASQHNDGIIFRRIQSDSIIEGMEERERKYSHPSRTIGRVNWEGFKPPFRINTSNIESSLKRPADLGTQDLATEVETRNTLTMLEGPVVLPSARLQEHSHSFSVSSGLHKAAHVPKSEEQGAKGSVSRQNMWLRRWSTTRAREERALLKSTNRERSIVHSGRLVENNYSTSQSSWESSHHFALRSAKRACYGQRIGLDSAPCQVIPVAGSAAVGREDQHGFDVASHFMKRFLTPSAAAMAIMGMTARRVHATKPQRGGLFGAWPVMNSSTNKHLTGQVEVGKDFLTRHKDKKEFLHSFEKPSSTHVDT